MRIDALTLRAVADELATRLMGARVDPVIAPTPHAVALQCYRDGHNHWLLLSAHPQLARVHILAAKPGKLVAEPTTFVMLLRKYLEMGRIDRVHWVPWERIIEIGMRQHDGERVDLIIEVMGKLSNIILVDDDRMVLGAIHPVGASINRYRTILPGQPYVAPPAQTRTLHGVVVPRLPFDHVTDADLMAAAQDVAPEESALPALRLLLANVAGAGQDTLTETLCRAGVAAKATIAPTDQAGWASVAAAMQDVADHAERGEWAPTAILDAEGQITDGTLWRPCLAASQPQRPMPGINALLGEYFAAREWQDALGGARATLRRTIKTTHDRLDKKLKTLRAELAALQQATQLRAEGEMLLVFATEILPSATTYTPPDLSDGIVPQPITLDPRLSAIENANARFARYHKMRRAAAQIPEQIERTAVDLARVEQLATDLDIAETLAEIAQVRDEVITAHIGNIGEEERQPRLAKAKAKGKIKGKGGKQPARPGSNPLTLKSAAGFPLYVGKNSLQNEYVTFVVAANNDLWFHARGVPGAHVVIKNAGRPVPPETIQEAARLAAWFSQSRGAGSVPVDYTEQRYVRHMKNGGPGMVIYTHEKTLHAVPREAAVASQ